MNNQQLIKLYFQRDERAIHETKAMYGRSFRSIALHITGNAEDAEECEDDLYLALWNSIPPENPEQHFYAYAVKIIRNKAFNRVRAERAQKRNGETVALSEELLNCIPQHRDIEEDAILAETLKEINTFLENLSVGKRRMFVRRYIYCDSVKDIAKMFGFTQNGVTKRLAGIRRQLQRHLKERGFYE